MITREFIIKEVINLSQELGKTPTRIQVTELKGIPKYQINKHFKTYNNLLVELSISPNKVYTKILTTCYYCSKEMYLPRYKIKENNFCSVQCSNKIHHPKLKEEKECLCVNCCNIFIKTIYQSENTNTCSKLCYMEFGMKNRTIKDVVKRTGANTYDRVRQNSRDYSKLFYPEMCLVCGYNKHYEVCHIKAIKDFDENCTLYEVNHITNLVHLCPNHHWELDYNMLNVDEIKRLQKNLLCH